MTANWEALARELGLIGEIGGCRSESGGTDVATRGLQRILGDELLVGAVDHYVDGRPGSELARSVLWLLHPPAAMERCREIWRTSSEAIERQFAINLLQAVADERVLPWIPEFLADEDDLVATWGIGVLDQLYWSRFVEFDACEPILALAEVHRDERVREKAAFIRGVARQRGEAADEPGTSEAAIAVRQQAAGGELAAALYAYADKVLVTSVNWVSEIGAPIVLSSMDSDDDLGRGICERLIEFLPSDVPEFRHYKPEERPAYLASGAASVGEFEGTAIKVDIRTYGTSITLEAAPLTPVVEGVCVRAVVSANHAEVGAAARRVLKGAEALRQAGVL